MLERTVGVSVLFLSCIRTPEEGEEEIRVAREEGDVVVHMLSLLEVKELWEAENWAEKVAAYVQATKEFQMVRFQQHMT